MIKIFEPSEICKGRKPYYNANDTSNPPYFDPYNTHIHKFIKGKLNVYQNSQDPLLNTFSYNKDSKLSLVNEYCSICHEINYNSLPLTNTFVTPITKIDKYEIFENYNINEFTDILNKKNIQLNPLLYPLHEKTKQSIQQQNLKENDILFLSNKIPEHYVYFNN